MIESLKQGDWQEKNVEDKIYDIKPTKKYTL